jgi:hypothetical protein
MHGEMQSERFLKVSLLVRNKELIYRVARPWIGAVPSDHRQETVDRMKELVAV